MPTASSSSSSANVASDSTKPNVADVLKDLDAASSGLTFSGDTPGGLPLAVLATGEPSDKKAGLATRKPKAAQTSSTPSNRTSTAARRGKAASALAAKDRTSLPTRSRRSSKTATTPSKGTDETGGGEEDGVSEEEDSDKSSSDDETEKGQSADPPRVAAKEPVSSAQLAVAAKARAVISDTMTFSTFAMCDQLMQILGGFVWDSERRTDPRESLLTKPIQAQLTKLMPSGTGEVAIQHLKLQLLLSEITVSAAELAASRCGKPVWYTQIRSLLVVLKFKTAKPWLSFVTFLADKFWECATGRQENVSRSPITLSSDEPPGEPVSKKRLFEGNGRVHSGATESLKRRRR